MEKRSERFFVTFVSRPVPFTYIPPTGNERGRKPIAMYVISGHSRRCSYSMNVVVHGGKQRLSKPRDCHQILSPLPEQNDDLRFCLRDGAKNVNGGGRRERAPVNFLKPIPYRHYGEITLNVATCGSRVQPRPR